MILQAAQLMDYNDDFDEEDMREAKRDGHRSIIMVDRGKCHFVLKAKHI